METTVTSAIPSAGSRPASEANAREYLLFHLLATLWIVSMLLFARFSDEQYTNLMQEDQPIEWGTVWLFAAAGIIHLRKAIRHRLIFDGLVALFCLFVAGEEFSWGQRLLGFGSPEYFLANNFQQEVNLHNLPGSFVKPKWILIFALSGYGILLPILARSGNVRRILARLGATPPPVQLLPWFAVAVLLLLWYPVTLTGEWVEFLAGSLFLFSKPLNPGTRWTLLSLALIFGISMAKVTGAVERSRDVVRANCSQTEIQALVNDLTSADAATDKLKRRGSSHRRLWTAISEGYVNRDNAREFNAAQCSGSTIEEAQERRRYAVDPWGMSYWLHIEKVDKDSLRIMVYSFGANRRRDGAAGTPAGDDIGAFGFLKRQIE